MVDGDDVVPLFVVANLLDDVHDEEGVVADDTLRVPLLPPTRRGHHHLCRRVASAR